MKKSKSSLTKRSWNKMLNNRLAIFGLVIISTFILMALFAPFITSYDPNAINLAIAKQAPSRAHIFGTDQVGRDVFARILYGARTSITVGIVGSLSGSTIGMIFGCIAGYFGGKVDTLLVKLSEMLLTFPQMILILIMVSIMGQGISNIIFIFSITGWMTTFRMVRNEFLVLREETYVEVNKAFGLSDLNIMFKQILPNTISPVVVATTLNIAGFILEEASLSFLGIGVPNNVATWGNIMNAAKSIDIVKNAWWLWVVPGITISLFVMAINFLGDGLRDVLDPKQ